MVEIKVGAEPRIKHWFNKAEGFHVGVSRDEWGSFRSRYNPYTFVNGYFFTYGEWFAKNHKFSNIEKYWEANAYGTDGYKDACFAVIDRNRKVAVIKRGHIYTWQISRAIPDNFTIYEVHHIPCFDPCNPKNKKILIKEVARTLIERYMNHSNEELKVLHSNKKCCRWDSANNDFKDKIKKQLEDLVNKHRISTKSSLFDNNEFYYITSRTSWGNENIIGKVPYPTIDQIINDTYYSDKEKEHIAKCSFYYKYIYNKPTDYKWKDVDKLWNTLCTDGNKWQDNFIEARKEAEARLEEKYKAAKAKARENEKEAIAKYLKSIGVNNIVDYWRENNAFVATPHIYYYDCYIEKGAICWTKRLCSRNFVFDNIQLKLNGYLVVTSKGVTVSLTEAINFFNILYVRYLIQDNITYVDFTKKNIKLVYYQLRHIVYREKVTDGGVKLGYKEWNIQIGCHSLWFDDIQNFAKYYHLEDRLAFPVDIDSQTCRNNHILHTINK